MLLSNESPILIINQSSLNHLNELIEASGGIAVQAQTFRANMVVAQVPSETRETEPPYVEDEWRFLQIGQYYFKMLGPCRRCQMICVDQQTAQRKQEPYSVLAKTRRFNGKIYFGEHCCLLPTTNSSRSATYLGTIAVGDLVTPCTEVGVAA